jgi:hypothetical protein
MAYSGLDFNQISNKGTMKQGFRMVTINMKQQVNLATVIM